MGGRGGGGEVGGIQKSGNEDSSATEKMNFFQSIEFFWFLYYVSLVRLSGHWLCVVGYLLMFACFQRPPLGVNPDQRVASFLFSSR